MPGVLVNVGAVLLGGGVGLLLGKRISPRFQKTMVSGLALCILLIGAKSALGNTDIIGAIVCMALGAILGEALDIEKRLDAHARRVQHSFRSGAAEVAQGFVASSLLFCVGAMAVVGSLDAGMYGRYETLFAKAVLDGVSALLMAASMGVGVVLSAVTLLVYQGLIALLGGLAAPLLGESVVALMSGVGGLLICGLGLNMLGICHIKAGNLLPAVFIPLIYAPVLACIKALMHIAG